MGASHSGPTGGQVRDVIDLFRVWDRLAGLLWPEVWDTYGVGLLVRHPPAPVEYRG